MSAPRSPRTARWSGTSWSVDDLDHSAAGGERSDTRKGSKAYESALLRQRYSDLRAAVIRDGLPMLVARIEAAELRTVSDD